MVLLIQTSSQGLEHWIMVVEQESKVPAELKLMVPKVSMALFGMSTRS